MIIEIFAIYSRCTAVAAYSLMALSSYDPIWVCTIEKRFFFRNTVLWVSLYSIGVLIAAWLIRIMMQSTLFVRRDCPYLLVFVTFLLLESLLCGLEQKALSFEVAWCVLSPWIYEWYTIFLVLLLLWTRFSYGWYWMPTLFHWDQWSSSTVLILRFVCY